MMDLSWIITTVLGIIIVLILFEIARNKCSYWEKRGFPYIKSTPIIGEMSDVIFMRKSMGDVLDETYKKLDGEKFGGFFNFTMPIIMIRDPELIIQILIKDFSYFEDRGPPMKGEDNLFNLSLGNLTGDKWRNARHKLTPSFTSGKLKMMFGTIKECSDELVDYLENKTDQELEARNLMSKCILNVIGNIAFGLKLDTLNEKDEKSVEFLKYTSSFFKPSITLFMKFMISFLSPKLAQILNLKLIDEEVETFFRKLTYDVSQYREETSTRRNDFLQLMLDLKKKEKEILNNTYNTSSHDNEPIELEDKELLDQLKNTPMASQDLLKSDMFTELFISSQTFLFIAGGSETTAAALSFILYELGRNPDLQKKVQDEITSVLSFQEFSYQSIKKMNYMEQFINETLRLHPVMGLMMRVCTRDYKIPGTNLVIEKGTFVCIPAGGLHKDPQYFPQPEKFGPDRFENIDAIHKGVYFSFGIGPRMCIAMRLAMLEMKVILAALLLNYTITLSEKTKSPLKLAKNTFFVYVDGGVWIKFKRRNECLSN